MNNLKNTITMLLGLIIMFSCSNYLDVSPRKEVEREELFKTEHGFEEALAGVYITLKSASLYGYDMTLSSLEHLVSNWAVKQGTTNEALNLFQYNHAGVEAKFKSIYAKAYYAIAQVNCILEYIDAKNNEGVFTTPGFYELVKGECLAIRAFCHFDLLRLFGPVPTQTDQSKILTYMTALTKDPVFPIDFESFKLNLFEDVNASIELLSNDPIVSETVLDLRKSGWFRDVKFNYYAALALKSRMHLWFGEKQDAYSIAKQLIDATDAENEKKFPLGTSASMDAGDFPLSCENLLGLYVHNLPKINSDKLSLKGELTQVNKEYVVNHLYEGSESDIRPSYLWKDEVKQLAVGALLLKYENEINESQKDLKVIPLIRISEMYFIAIECADDENTANELWKEYLAARNLPVADLPVGQLEKQLLIVKEYRKEFFAEGQAFFTYKRLNFDSSQILWIPTSVAVNYLIPLPKTEIVTQL